MSVADPKILVALVSLGRLLVRALRAAGDRLERPPRGVAVGDRVRHRAAELRAGRLLPDEEPQLLTSPCACSPSASATAPRPSSCGKRVDFARARARRGARRRCAARGVGREAVVLSTCNRAEIYAAAESDAAADALGRFFSDYHSVEHCEHVAEHLYVTGRPEAARHLFRVAAGLDSLVVGEPQILGQVKAAYAAASDLQLTGALTNRLFHSAFAVGKRVRTETGLGEGAVSVSYAAIALAKKIFGEPRRASAS